MYKISARLLRIPKELSYVQEIPKYTQINKIIGPSITKTINFHSDKKYYDTEELSEYSYKYILCSLLFGTVSYTTYTIW